MGHQKMKIILVKWLMCFGDKAIAFGDFKLIELVIFKFNLVVIKLFRSLHFFGGWSLKSGDI